ncbi:hypothetical protein Tco_1264914 [Tanacetum coccineum]
MQGFLFSHIYGGWLAALGFFLMDILWFGLRCMMSGVENSKRVDGGGKGEVGVMILEFIGIMDILIVVRLVIKNMLELIIDGGMFKGGVWLDGGYEKLVGWVCGGERASMVNNWSNVMPLNRVCKFWYYPYERIGFASYKYQDARGKRVANKEWPTLARHLSIPISEGPVDCIGFAKCGRTNIKEELLFDASGMKRDTHVGQAQNNKL